MSRTACVYRAYDANDVLLYVGQSTTPKKRIAHHKSHKSWAPLVARWTVSDPMPVGDALDVESWAILRERPVYNIAGTDIGAAYGRWERSLTKRQKRLFTTLSNHVAAESFETFMSDVEIRPLEVRMAEAIQAVREADPSVTDEEFRFALDNWYGPFSAPVRTA